MEEFKSIMSAAIKEALVVGGVSGPLPGVDIPGIAAVQGRALLRIYKLHNRACSIETIMKLALSLLTAVSTYRVSMKVFGWILYAIPGLGIIANGAFSAIIDGLITYRMCKYFDKLLKVKEFGSEDFQDCVYMLLAVPTFIELKAIYDIVKG